MREVAVVVLALVGLAFSLSGAVGVVRMPDVYSRVQSSTKTITLGLVPALLALVVGRGFFTTYGAHALLVAVLIGVLNPAASHALSRAAHRSGIPQWRGAVTDESTDDRPGGPGSSAGRGGTA